MVTPIKSNGSGSRPRTAFPFPRPTGDLFSLVKPFSSRTFTISKQSSTFLRDAWRLGRTPAVDGYLADVNEDENLWRRCTPVVSITFDVVAVGNPATTHSRSLSYAPPSITGRQNDQRSRRARRYAHAERTRNDMLQKVGATSGKHDEHLGDLRTTPTADCFYGSESVVNSPWPVQCLRTEHVDIKCVLFWTAIWWHDAGAKKRVAATLF